MFKKFTTDEVSTQNQIKSSVQRGVRGKWSNFVCRGPVEYGSMETDMLLAFVQLKWWSSIPTLRRLAL